MEHLGMSEGWGLRRYARVAGALAVATALNVLASVLIRNKTTPTDGGWQNIEFTEQPNTTNTDN